MSKMKKNIKLRYFQIYDENGVDSEPELQHWNEEYGVWETIPFVRVSYKDADKYMHKTI